MININKSARFVRVAVSVVSVYIGPAQLPRRTRTPLGVHNIPQ